MVGAGASPLGRIVPRRAAAALTEALLDTRVVVLTGARQSGKSTLVRLLAGDRTAEWRNLDSAVVREAVGTHWPSWLTSGLPAAKEAIHDRRWRPLVRHDELLLERLLLSVDPTRPAEPVTDRDRSGAGSRG